MKCQKCGKEVPDKYYHREVEEYFNDGSGEPRIYVWRCDRMKQITIDDSTERTISWMREKLSMDTDEDVVKFAIRYLDKNYAW